MENTNDTTESGKSVDKKIGDYIFLFEDCVHQIRHEPNIFKSNRYATEEEIEQFKKTNKLWEK